MICPSCHGLTEKDEQSCSCGWRAQSAVKTKPPKLCVFNDHGLTCGYPGFLSNTTNGDGPWYCKAHFARIMGWPALEASVLKDDSQEAVNERVNKLVPRSPGESVHDWAMRCRQWTMDHLKRPLFQTEPGELG
jgi:hypothetical protein